MPWVQPLKPNQQLLSFRGAIISSYPANGFNRHLLRYKRLMTLWDYT